MLLYISRQLFFIIFLLWSGVVYAEPNCGIDAYFNGDYPTALAEFQICAEAGDAKAQYNLGLMYEKAKGTALDYTTAHHWYRKSARQGHTGAQFKLGLMHYFGLGADKSLTGAYFWFTIAHLNGHWDGARRMQVIEKTLTPTQIKTLQKTAQNCIKTNYKNCPAE